MTHQRWKRRLLWHRFPLRWLQSRLDRQSFLLLSGILVGLTAGLAAVLLKTAVHFINRFFIEQNPFDYPSFFLPFFPLLGIFAAVALVRWVYKGKDGKGIARVLHAIARKSSMIPGSRMHSQLLTSSVTVGLGGSSGLEGPIVVTGAAIGSNFGRVYHVTYKDRTLLLAAGVAAGIAAVFNAPIAGVMFAIEVVLSGIAITEFIPLIVAAVSGALCSHIILRESILFNVPLSETFDYRNVPYYVLLGLFCGAVSLYYAYVNRATERRLERIKNPWWRALGAGVALAALCFLFPPLFGEGYHSITELFTGEAEALLEAYELPQAFPMGWSLLVLSGLIALFKVWATSLTIHGGGNGGNFAPSLFTGGFVGFFFARLLNQIGLAKLPENSFVLVGMAGVLAGVMFAPLTAIFLIAELSGGYGLMIPLMIVSVSAYLMARAYRPYSMELLSMARKGQIFTGHKDQDLLQQMELKEVLETDVSIVAPEDLLGSIVQVVRQSRRNIFAVVDKDGRLKGVISLETLKSVMFNTEQYEVLKAAQLMDEPAARIQLQTPVKEVVKKFEETQQWNLPVEQGGKYVGFVSRSTVFTAYRKKLVRLS